MKKTTILATLTLFLPINIYAVTFDFIAPNNVYLNQDALGPGIGTSAWGLLVATDSTITLGDLQSAVVIGSIDSSDVTFNNNQPFNETFFAPLLPGEVAGYVSPGPVVDNSSLLSLLNPGETIKNSDVGLTGISLSYPNDFLGTVDFNYELILGDQSVEFTTQLHFVPNLPDGLWYEITDGTRLTSTAVSAVPIPSALWLFASGLLGFVGIAKRKI